jgi:Domain of unknown function (DUF4261)
MNHRRDFLRGLLGAAAPSPLAARVYAAESKSDATRQGQSHLRDQSGERSPKLVLCIPGPWKTRGELVRSIVQSSSGYLFAGQILMRTDTKFSCELEFSEADARMSRAFAAAGPHWRNSPEMAAISSHGSVVYLVGAGGSTDRAREMMLAARALLLCGGLGVKVESAGVAHSPSAWLDLTREISPRDVHAALVVYVTGSDVYSCGMHNVGLRDAITNASDSTEAVELVRVFTRYLYEESPTILDGQTFSVSADAPVYRIHDDPGETYEPDSLFANPYGFWRLELIRRA